LELGPFVQTVLIDEVRSMHGNGVRMHTLAAVAHGIEVCGALLDAKPFKAKGLGRSRFQLALSKLFPKAYLTADAKVDLYGQLRSHMSHSMVPGQLVVLDGGQPHLTFADGTVHLAFDTLVSDYFEAVSKLQMLFEAGKLKPKRIAA